MRRKYTPRRQSARWLDSDCPKGVLAILDAGKTTNGRWTVIYAEPVVSGDYHETILGYRGMCSTPFAPCGVGLYGEMPAHDAVYVCGTLAADCQTYTALIQVED